jgi:hypothetical protein
MSFLTYLADEKYKMISDAVGSGVGFFIALFAKSRVDDWQERKSFATILEAVRAEARSNEVVLHKSFLDRYEEGIVFREFWTSVVSSALTNPLFIKHAPQQALDSLMDYLRDISLANTYRAKAETIRFSDAYFDKSHKHPIMNWEPRLIESWKENLGACGKSIAAVKRLQIRSR